MNVIQYLARYTHRVAIANGRLLEMRDGQVVFRWRDSADGNQQKLMTLDAVEFIRRFLLHVLPVGFVKIRHFGFLANRNRREALLLCRSFLPTPLTFDHLQRPVSLGKQLVVHAGPVEIRIRLSSCINSPAGNFPFRWQPLSQSGAKPLKN